MAFFKSAIERHQKQLDEEYLYGYVANEISNNHVSPGLWTKALVAVGGDEQKARIQYIKYRFEMLKLEDAALGEVVKKLKALESNGTSSVTAGNGNEIPSSYTVEVGLRPPMLDRWQQKREENHNCRSKGTLVFQELGGNRFRYRCDNCGLDGTMSRD